MGNIAFFPKLRPNRARLPMSSVVAMLLRERALYHQVHPLKLAVDILTEPISLYLLWRHYLTVGLIAHFAPPIAASALMVSFGSFEAQKCSALGRYVSQNMTPSVQAARFLGDIVMVLGAWYRGPGMIATGVVIVAAAWLSGLVRPRNAD